jgi:hypothetical protein
MRRFTRMGIRWLFAAFVITMAAHGSSIFYIFGGTDTTGGTPEAEMFQLTVPDFISPPLNSFGADVGCAQLGLSSECVSPGLIFSQQSVLGAFSDQLQFNSPDAASVYDFPTGAFTTPGTYFSQPGENQNIGSLTVTDGPEPNPMALTLCAVLLLFSLRVKKLE